MTKKHKGDIIDIGSSDGPTQAGWHTVEDFLVCPKMDQFRRVRGIGVKLEFEPPYFTVGRMMHAGVAKWFARGFKTSDVSRKLVRQAMELEAHKGELPPRPEALRDGHLYMDEYIAFWSMQPKPEPMAAEYLLGPSPFRPGDPFFLYRTARLDDFSRYPEGNGELFLGERKTTSGSIQECVQQYTLHGQTMLQLLLWKLAPQGEKKHGPVRGVMLDVIQKGYGKPSKFARAPLYITDYQLSWFSHNLAQQLRAQGAMDWNTDAPRYVTSCARKIGNKLVLCEFQDLCRHGGSASGKYVFSKTGLSLRSFKPDVERKAAPWD